MRLTELNPMFRRVYRNFDPRTGGEPTDTYEVSFSCPTCGPPCRVAIKVGPTMDAAEHRWQATPPEPPPDGSWMNVISLQPSINNTTAGHGPRRPPCTFHGHITSGEVSPAPGG